MSKTGPVSEGLAAILWAASAVKIAGYTYQSFGGTYSQFPSPGGGGGGGTVEKVVKAVGKEGTAIVKKVPKSATGLQPADTKGGVLNTIKSGAENAIDYLLTHAP